MREENTRKTIIIGSIAFALVVGVMLFLLFTRCDILGAFDIIRNSRKEFLIISIGMICIFIVCEALNVGRVLKVLGERVSFMQSIRYSASGLFFSDITPSASGGQPMQLFFMHRDKVHISHGMISLFTDALSFQTINCGLGILGLFYNLKFLAGMGTGVKVLMIAGLAINMCALAALMLALFSPGAVRLFKRIAGRMIKSEIRRDKINNQLAEYEEGAAFIKQNRRVLFRTLLTSLVQFTALYSIPFCVYLALGLDGRSWLDLFMMQALLNAGISAIPMPGTVGIGESGFRLMFASIFIGSTLMPGMILCRGVSLYLALIIAGLTLIVAHICVKIKNGRSGADDHQEKTCNIECIDDSSARADCDSSGSMLRGSYMDHYR